MIVFHVSSDVSSHVVTCRPSAGSHRQPPLKPCTGSASQPCTHASGRLPRWHEANPWLGPSPAPRGILRPRPASQRALDHAFPYTAQNPHSLVALVGGPDMRCTCTSYQRTLFAIDSSVRMYVTIQVDNILLAIRSSSAPTPNRWVVSHKLVAELAARARSPTGGLCE
eukprot:COSAG01_NODE_3549_length_5949_cov_4.859829_2_plen_168_part_00